MPRVLVVNTGSSSIKYQLFDMPEGSGEPEQGAPVDRGHKVLASGAVERIGEAGARLTHRAGDTDPLVVEDRVADHSEGFDRVFGAFVAAGGPIGDLAGIGHRVVHGGDRLTAPTLIDDAAIAAIADQAALAPLHNPSNLLGIRIAMASFPQTPQVAVFDTAFHQTMPPRAWRYALPRDLAAELRIRRYGFHGTSHAYVSRKAAEHLGRPASELNLITLHLGNGASAAAVAGGRCIDTSMGLTPLEGLVMGTRSGDLDSAVVFYLHREAGMSVDDIDDLLNKRSGMLGLAGANDMREVARLVAEGDEAAGGPITDLAGIGHRVVHGGDRLTEPTLIDAGAIAAIADQAPLAPLHNPSNLLGIRITLASFPDTPQVAVFDTAFHQTMPPRAWRYALPAPS
jgi:acetate kinase